MPSIVSFCSRIHRVRQYNYVTGSQSDFNVSLHLHLHLRSNHLIAPSIIRTSFQKPYTKFFLPLFLISVNLPDFFSLVTSFEHAAASRDVAVVRLGRTDGNSEMYVPRRKLSLYSLLLLLSLLLCNCRTRNCCSLCCCSLYHRGCSPGARIGSPICT